MTKVENEKFPAIFYNKYEIVLRNTTCLVLTIEEEIEGTIGKKAIPQYLSSRMHAKHEVAKKDF